MEKSDVIAILRSNSGPDLERGVLLDDGRFTIRQGPEAQIGWLTVIAPETQVTPDGFMGIAIVIQEGNYWVWSVVMGAGPGMIATRDLGRTTSREDAIASLWLGRMGILGLYLKGMKA